MPSCIPTHLLWRRSLRSLRDECCPLLPVRVRLGKKPVSYFGYTALADGGTHFNLTVHSVIREQDGSTRVATRQELIDSLVHEWAHCLSWNVVRDLEAHGPEWGVAYARCYQAVIED